MRLVIQRVKNASVRTEGKEVGKINEGLFVLLGVGEGDSEKEIDTLAEKLVKLRVMADENGKMNLSVKEMGANVLVVSQFTLYGNTTKGNRPSFVKAARPKKAQKLYERFVVKIKEQGIEVETGEFGSYMNISSELDGPVTIIMEK